MKVQISWNLTAPLPRYTFFSETPTFITPRGIKIAAYISDEFIETTFCERLVAEGKLTFNVAFLQRRVPFHLVQPSPQFEHLGFSLTGSLFGIFELCTVAWFLIDELLPEKKTKQNKKYHRFVDTVILVGHYPQKWSRAPRDYYDMLHVRKPCQIRQTRRHPRNRSKHGTAYCCRCPFSDEFPKRMRWWSSRELCQNSYEPHDTVSERFSFNKFACIASVGVETEKKKDTRLEASKLDYFKINRHLQYLHWQRVDTMSRWRRQTGLVWLWIENLMMIDCIKFLFLYSWMTNLFSIFLN